MIHYIQGQYKIKVSPNQIHIISLSPPQRRHVDGPIIRGQNGGVRFSIELEVRDDVWEVGDRDISIESSNYGNSN